MSAAFMVFSLVNGALGGAMGWSLTRTMLTWAIGAVLFVAVTQ